MAVVGEKAVLTVLTISVLLDVPRRRKAKSERKEAMIYIRVTTDQKQA